MWLGRQKKIRLREGDLLWVYLIVYSLGRFAIELIRLDSATVGGLKTPAVIAIATIVIAWTMLIYRHRPNSGAPYSESNLTEEELAQLSQRSTTGSRRSAQAHTEPTATAHESRVRKVTSFAQPDTGAEPPAKHDPMVQATEGQSES
jgi:Prolipoprotein diacylglyceryl transferase